MTQLVSLYMTPHLAYVCIGLLLALCVMLFWVWQLSRALTRQREMLVTLHSEQQSILATLSAMHDSVHLLEGKYPPLERRMAGLAMSFAALDAQIDTVRLEQDELIAQDPQVKRYQKASQLIHTGATIEELMEACELPRAEAELMMNMHQSDASASLDIVTASDSIIEKDV